MWTIKIITEKKNSVARKADMLLYYLLEAAYYTKHMAKEVQGYIYKRKTPHVYVCLYIYVCMYEQFFFPGFYAAVFSTTHGKGNSKLCSALHKLSFDNTLF